MEAFEYVVVLTSLILGLSIAQLLNGIVDLIADSKNVKFSLPHTLFAIMLFLVNFQDWFYTYFYSENIERWSMPIVLFILSFPLLLFVLTRFLFPTGGRSNEKDMNKYFKENWCALYTLFSFLIVISILQNHFILNYSLNDQIILIVYLAMYLLVIFTRNSAKIIHSIFMILQVLFWLIVVASDPAWI